MRYPCPSPAQGRRPLRAPIYHTFGSRQCQQRPVKVQRTPLVVIPAEPHYMQRVQGNDQQDQAVAAIPHPTPARPASRRRQGQQQVQPRLQAGGGIVADARIPPGAYKLGVVGIGQPFSVVAIAEQVMGDDQ